MTTFDALGLPIFETSDKIASSTDGLRQDLNLISTSAGNAITSEGARAEGAAVSSATSYADSKDTSNRSAWAAADTAKLGEAKTYADSKKSEAIGAAASDATSKANTAEGNAKTYADGEVAEDRARLTGIEDTAVFDGDGRLLADSSLTDNLLFAVVGKNDRRTWIEAGLDGKPTTRATSLVGSSVGVVDVPLDNGVQFAVVDRFDRIIFTPGSSAATYSKPQHPTDDWAHWGDSMTDNRALGANAWTNKLSALTGRNHYNGGVAGQKSAEIAARQGGLPALVTVPGNTIPATGSVTLTGIINNPVRVNLTLQVFGTLAGVPGYLQEAVEGVQTFTRTSDGAATVCPPKTRFIPTEGQLNRDRTVTIWIGRNNIFDGTTAQQVVSAIRAQLDFLGPDVKRAIVISVPSGEGLTATHGTLVAFNTAIREAFPAHWLDLDSWLRTPAAATAAGITFTADDNTDIAAGITPRSFRADYTHLNPTGATAVAYRVHLEAQNRGWL